MGCVHVAAYKAVGEPSETPVTYYHNNVAATIYLFPIMSEFDCARIVYSSSETVWRPPESTNSRNDSTQGRQPVWAEQVMCESVIDDLAHAEPTRWGAIYFNPVGTHPSGLVETPVDDQATSSPACSLGHWSSK